MQLNILKSYNFLLNLELHRLGFSGTDSRETKYFSIRVTTDSLLRSLLPPESFLLSYALAHCEL